MLNCNQRRKEEEIERKEKNAIYKQRFQIGFKRLSRSRNKNCSHKKSSSSSKNQIKPRRKNKQKPKPKKAQKPQQRQEKQINRQNGRKTGTERQMNRQKKNKNIQVFDGGSQKHIRSTKININQRQRTTKRKKNNGLTERQSGCAAAKNCVARAAINFNN